MEKYPSFEICAAETCTCSSERDARPLNLKAKVSDFLQMMKTWKKNLRLMKFAPKGVFMKNVIPMCAHNYETKTLFAECMSYKSFLFFLNHTSKFLTEGLVLMSLNVHLCRERSLTR